MSVREARLRSEFEAISAFNSDVVTVKPIGRNSPPDHYHLIYDLKTIVGLDPQGNPQIEQRTWTVEVLFPNNYPWGKPEVRFIGQRILHPNVWVNGDICIEDHWRAGIGIPFDSLTEHIGQIIAYQKYNLNSPANGDQQLRLWILRNGDQYFPTDSRDVRRARIGFGQQTTQTPSKPPAAPRGKIKFGS